MGSKLQLDSRYPRHSPVNFKFIHLEGACPTLTHFHPFKATSSEPWSSHQLSREAHARVGTLQLVPRWIIHAEVLFHTRTYKEKVQYRAPRVCLILIGSQETPQRSSVCSQPARNLGPISATNCIVAIKFLYWQHRKSKVVPCNF